MYSKRELEHVLKPKLTKIFNELDLKITIECNQKIVDFFNVTLDLRNGKYFVYRKENNEINYIHSKSNHPINVIGLTSNSFKARLANHKSSFKNVNKKFSSKLAEYVLKLQENNVNYEIKWNLICRANTFSTVSNTCNLCINEKMYIVYFPEMGSLNSKSELTSNCRQRSNLLLDKI